MRREGEGRGVGGEGRVLLEELIIPELQAAAAAAIKLLARPKRIILK